jgi:hypothetical protein
MFASLWIVFHLIAIVIVPNASSVLTFELQKAVVPYTNLIGFHSFWQFFSPDPGAAVFFRVRLYEKEHLLTTFDYPPKTDPYWIRSRYNRRVSSVRFFSRPPADGVTRHIGPFFCRQNAKATSAEISLLVMRPPTFDEVKSGSALNSLEHEQAQGAQTLMCDRSSGS